MGFVQSSYDYSSYIRNEAYGGMTIIVAYMDDMLIVLPCEKQLCQFTAQIEALFELRVKNSVTKYLEICIDRNTESRSLQISNKPLIELTLRRFWYVECKEFLNTGGQWCTSEIGEGW